MDIYNGVQAGSDISVVILIGLDGFARFVKRKNDIRTGGHRSPTLNLERRLTTMEERLSDKSQQESVVSADNAHVHRMMMWLRMVWRSVIDVLF